MYKSSVASVLYGAKDLRLEERSISNPEPGELQIEIRATGLCGSDLHYYQHYRNGDIRVQEPLALGHESAGVVSEIGPQVDGFEIGDHVALEVGVPCSACDRCAEGRYNLCKKMRFRSSGKSFPHFQGTLQQRINHPAIFCHKLPKGLPFQTGALIEPLSVAMHAVRRAQINLLSKPSVLIFGAGAIGLLCAAMCKISGADKIEVADIQGDRVRLATEQGFATQGVLVPLNKPATAKDSLEAAKATALLACRDPMSTHDGFDVVFECTGVESCTQAAIYAARPGGRVVVVGMGSPDQYLPISAAALREVDIIGSFRYASTYPEAIEILSTPHPELPDLGVLITHTFSGLASVESAFQMASRTLDENGKLVVKVMVTEGLYDQPQV